MAHCGGKSLWVGCGVYTVLSWYEKVQRLPRKYLPHNYSTNLSHEHWQDGSTCFCCLHQNSEQLDATAETHQTKPCFSSPLLSNFGELVLIVASALRSQLTGVTPGVVLCCSKVRHVGQSEMLSCIPPLEQVVIWGTAAFLSSVLSLSSSPLTSDLNTAPNICHSVVSICSYLMLTLSSGVSAWLCLPEQKHWVAARDWLGSCASSYANKHAKLMNALSRAGVIKVRPVGQMHSANWTSWIFLFTSRWQHFCAACGWNISKTH